MVDVRDGGRPGVAEIADALYLVVRRYILQRLGLRGDVLTGYVFEAHFSGPTNVNRNGSKTGAVIFGGGRSGEAVGIDQRAEDIGVNGYLKRIPALGVQVELLSGHNAARWWQRSYAV